MDPMLSFASVRYFFLAVPMLGTTVITFLGYESLTTFSLNEKSRALYNSKSREKEKINFTCTPMICYLQRLHWDDAIQRGNIMSFNE